MKKASEYRAARRNAWREAGKRFPWPCPKKNKTSYLPPVRPNRSTKWD